MKIIAYYLPQFHEIKENNMWWGEGFTEWVNVKNAKELYDGHYQPRIPLNNNYYNLLDDDVKEWQIKLAKENGIYGFCFYHYWFNEGHLLLEKPVEQFLKNKSLNIHFCLSWANEPWTKAWVSKSDSILIDQNYGNKKTWEKHFNYLLPFFKDYRYIKENNKPLFIIYKPEQIECLNEMLDYWNELAIKNKFSGIDFAYQAIGFDLDRHKDDSRFTYDIEYEPAYGQYDLQSNFHHKLESLGKILDNISLKIFNKTISEYYIKSVRKINYDKVWEAIINHKPKSTKCIGGGFVDWDNTPRRGNKGLVIEGATPDKFHFYLSKKIESIKKNYKNDYLFLFAWNEWAEGGYLEPDIKYGTQYLNAIREALLENNEWPKI